MNCLKCGAELKRETVRMDGEYAGEKYTATTEAMVCSSCGFTTLHASQIDGFRTKLADSYREAHGLLTSGEIRTIRSRLGMSQEGFAKYLGVGVASVKRWELGRAQDQSSDELIRLKSSVQRAEQNLADVLFQQGGEADEYSGGRPFDLRKLAAVMLFFLENARREHKSLGPLHMNKLCWYADAENYRQHGASITGSRYARLPLGPALDEYRLIFAELNKRNILRSKNTTLLEQVAPYNPDDLPAEDKETLGRVWHRFHNRLGKIVKESHDEPAWKQAEHAGLISFRLAARAGRK